MAIMQISVSKYVVQHKRLEIKKFSLQEHDIRTFINYYNINILMIEFNKNPLLIKIRRIELEIMYLKQNLLK